MSAKKNDSEKTDRIIKDLKGLWDSGIAAAKKGLKKSGDAITEFGDFSVMKIDSAKNTVQLEKKYNELGKICAGIFFESDKATVTRKSEGVAEKLDEIKALLEKVSGPEKEFEKPSKDKDDGEKTASEPVKASTETKPKVAKKTSRPKKTSKDEEEVKGGVSPAKPKKTQKSSTEAKSDSPKKKTTTRKTSAKKE